MNNKMLAGLACVTAFAWLASAHANSILRSVHIRTVADDVQSIVSGRPDTPPNRLALQTKMDTPIEELTPIKSGPGLVVFSPSTSAPLRPFARSMAAWLDFMAAGQPEFGKSPRAGLLWEAIAERRSEAQDSDPAQNHQIAKVVGSTFHLIGTLTKKGEHFRLSYQCYVTATGKAKGAAIVAEGTADDLCAQLPKVARSIVTAMGGSTSGMPATSNLTHDDFEFMRGVTRENAEQAEPRYRKLAESSPYAALFYFSSYERDSNSDANWAVRQVVRQMPNNPIVLAEMSYYSPSVLVAVADDVDRMAAKYPTNSLWQNCAYELSYARNQLGQSRPLAQRMVRLAPHNAEYWRMLGRTAGNEADDFRHAVFINRLSELELAHLNTLYDQYVTCLRKATAIDPLDGRGWCVLCEAATFAGEPGLADDAFWKAAKLDTDKADIYYWGLEMYQPKWYDDPAKLEKVANLAINTKWDSADGPVKVAGELWNASLPKERDRLLKQTIDRLAEKVAASPGDGWAHWDLAAAYKGAWRTPEALGEYRAAEKLLPHNSRLHYLIGGELSGDEAVNEYRLALADDPDSAARVDLAWTLKNQGKTSEAFTEIEQAAEVNPYSYSLHYTRAAILESMQKPDQAIDEYKKAIDFDFWGKECYERICHLDDTPGHYDEAIQFGKQGLVGANDDATLIDQLADVYLNKNESELSAGLSQYAIGLNAKDWWAHENLGEALIKQGKRAEARKEWELVAASDNKFMSDTAKSFLEKYPAEAK